MNCPLCQTSLIFDSTTRMDSITYDNFFCPRMIGFKSATYYSHYTVAVFPDKKEEWIYAPPYRLIVLDGATLVHIHEQGTYFRYAFDLPGRKEIGDPNKLLERLKILTPFL